MLRLILLFALVLSTTVQAETTRYISDSFEVTMRTGHSGSHSIIKMLASGVAVSVLETDPDSGYTQVRTQDGKEGWVITRFLMAGSSAREQLGQSQKRAAGIEVENRRLMKELKQIQDNLKADTKQKRTLESSNRKLTLEMAEIKRSSANAIAIDAERKDLQSRTMKMERDLQSLQIENDSLKDRTARDWFMVGGGVMLFGIFTGLILSRMRWRKRSEWDSL